MFFVRSAATFRSFSPLEALAGEAAALAAIEPTPLRVRATTAATASTTSAAAAATTKTTTANAGAMLAPFRVPTGGSVRQSPGLRTPLESPIDVVRRRRSPTMSSSSTVSQSRGAAGSFAGVETPRSAARPLSANVGANFATTTTTSKQTRRGDDEDDDRDDEQDNDVDEDSENDDFDARQGSIVNQRTTSTAMLPPPSRKRVRRNDRLDDVELFRSVARTNVQLELT